jgi:hypothetical protein
MCVCFLNWNSALLDGRKIPSKAAANSPVDESTGERAWYCSKHWIPPEKDENKKVEPETNENKKVERYENKSFLPQLKDVQRFLERSRVGPKSLKSRRDALKHVLAALSRLPAEELDRLARLSTGGSDSDYAHLAREIMGRRA